ncbi:MAG: hypothetical protein Q9168_004376 [Polycauliona sp. 1 TL-2023]
MASLSTPARISLGLGLAASSFLAGSTFTMSTVAVPTILSGHTNASLLVSHWNTMFSIGKKMARLIRAFGKRLRPQQGVWWPLLREFSFLLLYGGSMMLGWGTDNMVDRFTILVLNGINSTLIDQAAKVTMGEGQVRALVENWGIYNLLRSGIAAVAMGLGLYGTL